MKGVLVCGKIKDAAFYLSFLSMWFGGNTKLSQISEKEVQAVTKLVLKGTKKDLTE